MLEKLLQTAAPGAKISTLHHNDTYGFDIKLMKGPDLGAKLLFTQGLHINEQQVKEGFESFTKIELYFCLPDFWNLETEYWPLEWLDKVAEVPEKFDTWFGPGDTIPAGNPPQILSDRFPANHFMLAEPIEMRSLFNHKHIKDTGIQFLGLIPISQAELDYKLRNSATVLLQRLEKKGHTEKVDLFRTSVCRKRFLGF